MVWLKEEQGMPTGLSSWASKFESPREARAACDRADWLFWLLLSSAESETLRRNLVSTGVSAVELSPALREGSPRVAAAHIWSAPSPHDRPPRSSRASLGFAAAVATAVVVLGDLSRDFSIVDLSCPAGRYLDTSDHPPCRLVPAGRRTRSMDGASIEPKACDRCPRDDV